MADQGPVQPCCEYGPDGHTEQQHHDASPCYDEACHLEHPQGRLRHPEDVGRNPSQGRRLLCGCFGVCEHEASCRCLGCQMSDEPGRVQPPCRYCGTAYTTCVDGAACCQACLSTDGHEPGRTRSAGRPWKRDLRQRCDKGHLWCQDCTRCACDADVSGRVTTDKGGHTLCPDCRYEGRLPV